MVLPTVRTPRLSSTWRDALTATPVGASRCNRHMTRLHLPDLGPSDSKSTGHCDGVLVIVDAHQ